MKVILFAKDIVQLKGDWIIKSIQICNSAIIVRIYTTINIDSQLGMVLMKYAFTTK